MNDPLSPVSFATRSSSNHQHHHDFSSHSLITPPTSGHPSADTTHTNGDMSKSEYQRQRRGGGNGGQPSPPSSVARSSVASQIDTRRLYMMEEALSEHYIVIKRYLAATLREQHRGPAQERARDKLQRLTAVQFQELSTDIYDELGRREDEIVGGGRNAPGNNVPNYLLPKSIFHVKRNQARQKLSTLPTSRFKELATDIFFELERRFPKFAGGGARPGSPAGSMMSARGPPPGRSKTQNGYSGARTQPQPFRPLRSASLASSGGPGDHRDMGRQRADGAPMPKTFQSNTIVPNKGIMVEDDDESIMGGTTDSRRGITPTDGGSAAAEQQEKISLLEEQLEELKGLLRDKDDELDGMRDATRERDLNAGADKQESERLQRDLEGKLDKARDLNGKLQDELDRIRREKADAELDMRRQMDESQRNLRRQLDQARLDASNAAPSADLQRRYEQMQDDLGRQQKVTDEVRRQATQYLQEMRSMSANSIGAFDKHDELLAHVSALERQVMDWKSRYARAKTQMRSLRASAIGLAASPRDISGVAAALLDSQGLVEDVHLTKFQISIDELLQVARRPDADADAVLESMKTVVQHVRSITAGIDGGDRSAVSDQSGSSNDTDASGAASSQQRRLKSRVSATANNLITACKNHAAAQGLAPVSLIDAAASHLTNAIIELVKLVKIRPSPANELDHDDHDAHVVPALLLSSGPLPRKSSKALANNFGMRQQPSHLSKSSTGSGTGYGAAGSSPRRDMSSSHTDDNNKNSPGLSTPRKPPPSAPGVATTPAAPDDDDDGTDSIAGLADYKTYLEDQTALLVQNIQPLVNTIRAGGGAGASLDGYVAAISSAIRDVKASTEATLRGSGNRALRKHATPVVDVLEECRRALVERGARGEAGRKDMPPLVFRIARAVKELVLRVDRIESGELRADGVCKLEILDVRFEVSDRRSPRPANGKVALAAERRRSSGAEPPPRSESLGLLRLKDGGGRVKRMASAYRGRADDDGDGASFWTV